MSVCKYTNETLLMVTIFSARVVPEKLICSCTQEPLPKEEVYQMRKSLSGTDGNLSTEEVRVIDSSLQMELTSMVLKKRLTVSPGL